MNCKPGDFAIAVSAAPSKKQNIGALVYVESLHDAIRWNVTLLSECSISGVVYPPGSKVLASDNRLRPIRDSDGEDEMLRIAGKPQEVSA